MAVIEVKNVRKRYGQKAALDGVDLTVADGEIFGIVGHNGAGKSTLVECVAGLRAPDSGTIEVLGLDPRREGRTLRQRLGVQLQEAALPEALRVGEALDLYASFYPNPLDPATLLVDWGLTDVRRTAFGKLSGGQKQRLFLALALIGDPRLAILDELTTGLDPRARRSTWDSVSRMRERGVTILLVTHFADELERLCDRVAVLSAGRVVALDTPAGLVERAGAQNLEDAVIALGETPRMLEETL